MILNFKVKEYDDVDDFFIGNEICGFVFKEIYDLNWFNIPKDFWKNHTEVEVVRTILNKTEGKYLVYQFSQHWEDGNYTMTGVDKILVFMIVCGELRE